MRSHCGIYSVFSTEVKFVTFSYFNVTSVTVVYVKTDKLRGNDVVVNGTKPFVRK